MRKTKPKKQSIALVPVDRERAKDVVSIIGEGVHTALRKYVDSPESAVAWRAIKALPDDEWVICVQMAAAQVLRFLGSTRERHPANGPVNLELADDVYPLLHEWDGV